MNVLYSIKYKFRTKGKIKKDELKKIFNFKLLNAIINLENENLLIKKI